MELGGKGAMIVFPLPEADLDKAVEWVAVCPAPTQLLHASAAASVASWRARLLDARVRSYSMHSQGWQ